MKKIYLFLGILIFLFIISRHYCLNNKKRTAYKIKPSSYDSIHSPDTICGNLLPCFLSMDSVCKKTYKIKVVSYFINDSIPPSGENLFYKLPISQVILISYKDSIVYEKPHFTSLISQRTYSGNYLPMQETSISNFGIVGNGLNTLFVVEASAPATQHEYLALINTKGELEFCLHHRSSIIYTSKGSLQEVLKKHNISDTIFRKGLYLKAY